METNPPRNSRLSSWLHGGVGFVASMLLAMIALANLATLLQRSEKPAPPLAEGTSASDDLYVGSVHEAGFLAARMQAPEEA